ncbi:MAG: GAF domain-containing protein [Actinobacteria bacterium]|nr:GAF domain-containing protein [Actinomycetota bacterium]
MNATLQFPCRVAQRHWPGLDTRRYSRTTTCRRRANGTIRLRPADVEIRVLGRFVVRRAGLEVPAGAFGGRQVRTLIRLLVTRRDTFVSRDVLAEALWPERMPADPSGNLNVLVRRARTALGTPSLIVTGQRGYSLVSGEGCAVDAEMFLGAVNAGHCQLSRGDCTAALAEFHTALGWWGGDPLAEDAYSDWAQDYRRILFAAHQQTLEEGAQAAFEVGALHESVSWSEAAVASEPLREPAYLLLARSLAASGDCVAALRTIKTLQHHFDEEGLSPSSEAISLERSIARRGFPEPLNEPDRLRALESYDIVGSAPEDTFDDLAKLAAQICHCPVAVVNFIAKDSRWIKASYGLPAGPREGPRGEQVCTWTVSQPGVLVIPDAAHDDRFRDLPRVKAGFHFYAGVPLINPEGYALGTLCVVDHDPRDLTLEQAEGLRLLARQVVVHLEQRRQIIKLTRALSP